jgi:hypothetical protein
MELCPLLGWPTVKVKEVLSH